MSDKPSQSKLTCYLFKEEFSSSLTDSFDETSLLEDGYRKLDLIDNSKGESIVGYLKKNSENIPAWKSKIEELFELPELKNISNSLIFFVKGDYRNFAFTNGYAHSAVETTKIEWDFGVKVALNTLANDQIRGVDTRKLSIKPHQKREVSNGNSTIGEYEFDFNEEFINSITGYADTHLVGTSITGRESLHVTKRIDLSEIEAYCNKLFEIYQQETYKEQFPFYDILKPCRDSGIYERFLSLLGSAFEEEDFSHMSILYPNIDDVAYYNYRFIYDKRYKDYDDITLSNILEFFSEKGIEITEIEFKKFKIKISDGQRSKSYSLLDYIVLEFDIDNRKYIHTNNQILEIEPDFYSKVNSEIAAKEIESLPGFEFLPVKFNQETDKDGKPSVRVESEGTYNKRLSESNPGTICLDRQNFRKFPGRSQDQVEICDIITNEKHFICIKFYKHSSAPLSHLLQQGYVSADLLYEVQEYREELNRLVEKDFGQDFIPVDELDRAQIKYIYGIATQADLNLAESLPFFTRISLRQNLKQMKRIGFETHIIRIPMTEGTDTEPA